MSEKLTHPVSFRLTERQHRALEFQAALEGSSVADVIRHFADDLAERVDSVIADRLVAMVEEENIENIADIVVRLRKAN